MGKGGGLFYKKSPFPHAPISSKTWGRGWNITINIWLYTVEKGGAKRRIRGRNSHKCAIGCCRDNRKSATSYNGNKRRSVIRRSKNKLQIVILCIEIFNTYTKFADKISVFSLFSPTLVLNTFGKGMWEKTLFVEKVFPHIYFPYTKKIISLQRRWRCGILRKECRQFPTATRWLS